MVTAEYCWNQGDSHARSRLPLRPACSRFSLSASALSALRTSLPHVQVCDLLRSTEKADLLHR